MVRTLSSTTCVMKRNFEAGKSSLGARRYQYLIEAYYDFSGLRDQFREILLWEVDPNGCSGRHLLATRRQKDGLQWSVCPDILFCTFQNWSEICFTLPIHDDRIVDSDCNRTRTLGPCIKIHGHRKITPFYMSLSLVSTDAFPGQVSNGMPSTSAASK